MGWVLLGCLVCQMGLGFGYVFGPLAPDILVNGVAPGLMEGTRMTERLTAEHIKRASSNSLLGKPASKEDIAAQVVVMCQTDTMTGQTVVIDSGRVFH